MEADELVKELVEFFYENHQYGGTITMYDIGRELVEIGVNNTENIKYIKAELKKRGVPIIIAR